MRIAEIGAGAVVTVVAAGVPRKPGEARLELVRRNAAILLQDAPRVVQHIPAGILPVAANPVAALAGLACDWAAMEEIPRDQSTALSVSTRIRGVVPSGGRGGHAQRRQPGYEGHRPRGPAKAAGAAPGRGSVFAREASWNGFVLHHRRCVMKEGKATVKDPVCGMEIDPKKAAATRTHDGQTFYFCSQGCAQAFDQEPQRYGQPKGA